MAKNEAFTEDTRTLANKILALCRSKILDRSPFIGTVAMSLDLKAVRDVDCPTACTDGSNVFFDVAFLAELNPETRLFVLAHEFWHVVMKHSFRCGTRDKFIFNIASDMEINQLLAKDGFQMPSSLMWPNNQHDKSIQWNFPLDLSAEEYYELLLEFLKRNGNNNSSEFENSMKGQASDSKGGKGKGSSSQISKRFDKHIYKDDKHTPSEGQPKVFDKYGEKGHDPQFNPSCENTSEDKINEKIVAAGQSLERSRGSMPGHIQKIYDKICKPTLRWNEILHAQLTKAGDNKKSWNNPNRRFVHSGTYLPSHYGDSIRVAVGIDTSGSTEREIPNFLAEVVGITQSFSNYEITLIQCDTQVSDVETYDENRAFDKDEYKIKGGGGTTLHPVFDYINQNDLAIDYCVMFTDGYCEEFKETEQPDYPTTWVLTTDPEKIKNIKFGSKIKYEPPEK